MTVYVKIENGQLITARNGYNGIIGFAESPELCLANGFIGYDEELVAKYYSGMVIVENGGLVDITDSDEYKAKIAQDQIIAKKTDLQFKLDEIDKNTATTRPLREYLISQNYFGYKNKIKDAEAQAVVIRQEMAGL